MDPLVGLFDPAGDDAEFTDMPESLPPEVEEGNVEYKLKLVNPSGSRFEHLVTQMKWRLQEGQGEAIYEIGVEDNGLLAGLTEHDMDASLYTLSRMAKRLGADISIIREKNLDTENGVKQVAEVLVRKVPDNQQFIDLRLAVLGNVDAGKSTLLGVLTQGELDNGHGRARLNLFRHLHEIQSGRTSSISHEILGFNTKGEVVNYSEARNVEEICENSTKLITLIDLCGHHKYLKTTIFGLTGYSPDFAMLVVSANSGIAGTTKEHLGFALALGVPIFVVISKVDMCRRAQVERTTRQLEKILKGPGCKKIPFRVESEDDAVTAASTFHNERNSLRQSIARSQESLMVCLGASSSEEVLLLPPTDEEEKHNCENDIGDAGHYDSHQDADDLGFQGNVQESEEPQPDEPDNSNQSDRGAIGECLGYTTPEPGEATSDANQAEVDGGPLQDADKIGNPVSIEDKDTSDAAVKKKEAGNVGILQSYATSAGQEEGIPDGSRNSSTVAENRSIEKPVHKTETVLFSSDQYESICPIFAVSSVSGKNLDLLTKFLNVLPPLLSTKEREQFMQELAEHQIDEVYTIQGVGVVAGGTVLRGTIKEGDSLLLGPFNDGHFQAVSISSIQRNRLPCRQVSAGQSCSLSVGNNIMTARKGMVLVSPELNPTACLEFEADIYVLFHTNYICRGFQTVIHVGNVRQTAIIVQMSKGCVQTNEKAVVKFRFISRPEYIRVGSRLLFREGRTKGMGEVTKIYPVCHVDNASPNR